MCGIHAVICDGASGEPPPLSQSLQQTLSSRGPDHFGQVKRDIPVDEEKTKALHLVFTSTVLALRGDHVVAQPLEDTGSGSVLCWNGEAWRLGNVPVKGNDGEAILAKLRVPESPTMDARETRETYVLNVLRSIEGPFAFLYYDAESKRLYYGRDRLGRRSLLHNVSEDRRSITFSSVADVPASGWQEVVADGVYSIRLDAFASASGSATGSWDISTYITRHDWVPSAPVDMVSTVQPRPSMSCSTRKAGYLKAYFPRSQASALSTQHSLVQTVLWAILPHPLFFCDIRSRSLSSRGS